MLASGVIAASPMAWGSGVSSASLYESSRDDDCDFDVEVVHWTPGEGDPARFVADAFARSLRTAQWIGLGRTSTAYWSAEGLDRSTGCPDTCRDLQLVETLLDGTRKEHLVGKQLPFATTAAARAALVKRLVPELDRLAQKVWPATSTITEGVSVVVAGSTPAPGRFVVAARWQPLKSATQQARYDIEVETVGCGCRYRWVGRIKG